MDHFQFRDGVMHAEDVSLEVLAADVGTPFYCYSSATIERHFTVFRDADEIPVGRLFETLRADTVNGVPVVRRVLRIQRGTMLLVDSTMLDARTLTFSGVMAVAPLDVDPREAFERVARASEIVRSIAPDAQAISAGMSHDFEAAIEFGATHLRIGSQITGKRPTPG
jgi:hypothetical protein